MKKLIFAFATLLAVSASTLAQATDCLYVGGMGGLNWVVDDVKRVDYNFKTGGLGAISIGRQFENGFALEGEYSYRYNSLSTVKFPDEKIHVKGNLKSSSYMANVLYHLPLNSVSFAPYFGVGLGYSHQKFKMTDGELRAAQKDSGFTYQFMAGVEQPLWDNLNGTLEYRLHKGKAPAYDNTLALGLKYYY